LVIEAVVQIQGKVKGNSIDKNQVFICIANSRVTQRDIWLCLMLV